MTDDYDARRDSFESYNVAIDAQRSKLLRSKAAPKVSETKIQQEIVQYLDLALPATYRFFAIPNGGARSAITGARLKAEGVKAGVPDIQIIRQGGWAAFLEVKTSKGRASKKQTEFIDWCGENSVPVALVRGVADVEAALLDWNIPVRARASV